MNKSIILASKSPRRQELMRDAGLNFTIKTYDTDESYPSDMPVKDVAQYIAVKKASAFSKLNSKEIVITADTIVIAKNQILGKPANENQARAMLQLLSNDSHLVITGVCLKDEKKQIVFDDITEVTFRALHAEEIDYYIKNYQPFDKAGAYGIQEWIGMVAIIKIVGSYFNVVGLPTHKIIASLKEF